MKRKTKQQQRSSAKSAPKPDPAAQVSNEGIEAYRKMLEEQVRYMRGKYPGIRLVADMSEEEEKARQISQRELLKKAVRLLDDILGHYPSPPGVESPKET